MKTYLLLISSLFFTSILWITTTPSNRSDLDYKGFDNYSITNQNILLPIEVIGTEGTVKEITFNLSASQASSSDRIFLVVNNLSYENKGSVKVNGNSWLSLNHTTTTIHEKELTYGGMTHGGFNTIRLTIPATGLQEGTNTIRFRFDLSDGISIGYRVIKMNILDSGDNELLGQSTFEEENPDNWTAPSNSSVSNGENLWYNKTLWNRYNLNNGAGFWYAYNGTDRPAFSPTRKQIQAKCTDCHAQDGRDLEMFSYSNHSIIERSKFHGLTEQEGKDIAAYIRSLSNEPNVGRHGRPWNPPYQPGPDLANKPIEEWAAGAGLDWVLEKDEDMAPYLFGASVNETSVKNYFDSNKMDDRTTIPVAVQFPDWKHWLPIVHPMDAFSENDFINTQGTRPLAATDDFLTWVNTNRSNEEVFKREFISRQVQWYNTFRFFISDGSSDPRHWRTLFDDSPAYQHLDPEVNAEIAATSLARFMAVKNFEIMNEHDLQDKTHWFVDAVDSPGDRQWPTLRYNVFEVPPHFTGLAYDNNSDAYEGQSKVTGRYESTNWYQLQFTLNGGNGLVGGTQPADFNYLNQFIGKTIESSGIDEPLRYFSTVNQMYQIRTWSGNEGTQEFDGYKPYSEGFRIRNQGLWTFIGINSQNSAYYGKEHPERILEPLEDIQPGLSKWVIDELLSMYMDEMNKPKNRLYNEDGSEHWDRNPDDNWSGKEIEYMLDRKEVQEIRDLPNSGLYQGHMAAKMFFSLKRLRETDADCDLLNEIIDWCVQAWPDVNQVGTEAIPTGFNSLRIENCAALSVADNKFSEMKFYPNPTEDIIHINIPREQLSGDSTIRIFNVEGKLLHLENTNSKQVELSLKEYANGVYFIKVTNGPLLKNSVIIKK